MPSIKIERQSKHNAIETFQRLRQLLDQDKELRRLDPNYKCHFETENRTGRAESKLFTASLQVKEGTGGCHIELAVELPFHLALVKGMVKKTLEKKLDETLS
jgi:hypothetical protein